MSADKRTPHTDALDTLGTIIDESQKRDAIHLGVEPSIAGETLDVGQHVVLRNGKAYGCEVGEGVGIVDPFLEELVSQGERFWLVVYPRKITSLRHVWEHPDFPASNETTQPVDKAASEAWLRNFAATADCPDYETLIAAAAEEEIENPDPAYYSSGSRKNSEYLHFNGLDAHGEIPLEFWDHLEVVTGKKFTAYDRPKWFSCSC